MSAPKFKDAPSWFFAWVRGVPYITSICGWTRAQVIAEVVKSNQMEWHRIYQGGGRVIRCKVTPSNRSRTREAQP